MTRFGFYDLMTKQVCCGFTTTFFDYIWYRGHSRTGHSTEEGGPDVEAVYHAEMIDFRDQIFVPVLFAAMFLLRVDKANGSGHKCGDDGVPDCRRVVERQIAEVFGRKNKNTQRTTACERGFASQVWEISYAFMFGAGRPSSFFLDKNPVDIVQEDAIRAFAPYLIRTKDEEKQRASCGKQDSDDDDDGASYRDTAAADESGDDVDKCLDEDDNVFEAGKG